MEVVRTHFKPEFLNRLDDVVVFRALGSEELTGIVDIQVGVLARRLAARRLTLQVTDAAREWLALNGFDPVYGARPLRRLVQSAIGDQLAKALLAGDIRDGDEVVVDWPDDVAGVDGETGLTRQPRLRGAPGPPRIDVPAGASGAFPRHERATRGAPPAGARRRPPCRAAITEASMRRQNVPRGPRAAGAARPPQTNPDGDTVRVDWETGDDGLSVTRA